MLHWVRFDPVAVKAAASLLNETGDILKLLETPVSANSDCLITKVERKRCAGSWETKLDG